MQQICSEKEAFSAFSVCKWGKTQKMQVAQNVACRALVLSFRSQKFKIVQHRRSDESGVPGAKTSLMKKLVTSVFLAFCCTICMRRDNHCTSSQKKRSSSSLPTKACIVERNSKSQLSPISHLHCDNLSVVMLSCFHLVKCYILTCHIHLRGFCDKRNALCSKCALSKILQY